MEIKDLQTHAPIDSVAIQADTTQLLIAARGGDDAARDALWPRVYDELRQIARHRLANFRPGDTLDTTALVHETFLRLVDTSRVRVTDRAHFLALAARAMRFILVDYARACSAQKRGGGVHDLTLDEGRVALHDRTAERAADVLSLHEALDRLSAADARLGSLVEYRFFGGLTYEEIAELTGRSIPTVKRDWRRARAWLYHSMSEPGGALT